MILLIMRKSKNEYMRLWIEQSFVKLKWIFSSNQRIGLDFKLFMTQNEIKRKLAD